MSGVVCMRINMAYQRFNKQKYQEAYDFRLKGRTYAEIGKIMNVSPSYVGYMCRVMKLKERNK